MITNGFGMILSSNKHNFEVGLDFLNFIFAYIGAPYYIMKLIMICVIILSTFSLFFSEQKSMEPTLANNEVFNMIATEDLARKTLSQIFIEKYNKIDSEKKTEDENVFLATVEALEIDGINLRQPPVKPKLDEETDEPFAMKTSKPFRRKLEFPSMDELVSKNEDDKI